MRHMTFEIPEDVAEKFLSVVPEAERSHLVAQLLRREAFKVRMTDEEWEIALQGCNDFDDAADDAWLAEMRKACGMEDEGRMNGDFPSPHQCEV